MYRKEFTKKSTGNFGGGRGGGGFNRGGYQGNKSRGGGNGEFGSRPQTAQNKGGLFTPFNENQSRFNYGGDDGGNQYRQSKNDGFQYQKNRRGGGGGGFGGSQYDNRDRDSYQKPRGGGGGFGGKPSKSLVSMSVNPEQAQSDKVMVYTNQFQLNIGKNCPVLFQYPISIEEELEECDKENVHKYTVDEYTKVVDRETKRIELLVGKFIHSGLNIWTTQKLCEDKFSIESRLSGRKVTLVIEREGEFMVNPADINNTERQNSQAMSQVLNVVVKEAMRETGLIQMGKRPQFFNYQDPTHIQNMNMQVWSGFKTCAYKYSKQCTLVIDNCYKFMSTNTVLDIINEVYDEVEEKHHGQNQNKIIQIFQMLCRQKLQNKSIIANYGKRRTYIVQDIIFEGGPCASFFDLKNNESISVAKYFYITYKLKVTDKRQPMIMVKQQGKMVKIPSEFCLVDGVPEQIRGSAQGMRKLLEQIRQKPHEKMQSLEAIMANLNTMKKWKDFDIKINDKPEVLESRRLDLPELQHSQGDSQRLFCTERLLKQMPVHNSEKLMSRKLVLLFPQQLASFAHKTIDGLLKCQGQLGMKATEIDEIQIPDARDKNLKQNMFNQIDQYKSDQNIKDPSEMFAIIMVNHDNDYQPYKVIMNGLGISSQVIHKKSFFKGLNLSVASNIMKQINSKSGGESIQVKLPKFCKTSKVMLIGIDVCHAGQHSVVGFVTTTNKQFTSHYSDIILQPKYQEIVKKDLDRCLGKALNEFILNHKGLPDKIIIFRDGLGEQQMQHCIDKEVAQIKFALLEKYNKMNPPQITLIVVNKRINQRMFCQDRGGQVINPPPGTIIDKQLVENFDNNCYDFFMVPQQTTVGCVTPTHFYVKLNESHADVSKEDIENLTFCQTFMYSNWSGSIKVPAVCQLAHKIAEFHHQFDRAGNLKKGKLEPKQLAYNPNMLSKPYYL